MGGRASQANSTTARRVNFTLPSTIRQMTRGVLCGVPYLGIPSNRLYLPECGHACRFLYCSSVCCRCGGADERESCQACKEGVAATDAQEWLALAQLAK